MTKKRKGEDQEKFKYLTPEEQDKIILGILSKHANRSDYKRAYTGWDRMWTPEAVMIRRQIIIEYISQGLNHNRITLELMDRWDICRRTAITYLKDAINYMAENIAEFNQRNYEVAVTRIESIIEDALAHNNRKEALQAIDLLNKIQGLYVNKVEADVKADTTIEFKFGGE